MHSLLLCPSCPDAPHDPAASTQHTPRLQTGSTLGRGGAWLSEWCQVVQCCSDTSENQSRGYNVPLVRHSEPTTGKRGGETERNGVLPPPASSWTSSHYFSPLSSLTTLAQCGSKSRLSSRIIRWVWGKDEEWSPGPRSRAIQSRCVSGVKPKAWKL